MQGTWWLSQSRHTGGPLRAPYATICRSRFRRGLPGLHTMHYLICIMHQEALNFKLWMYAKNTQSSVCRERGTSLQIIGPLSVKMSNQGDFA